MKNITITLTEKAAEWARREATRKNMSVSRLVGDMLEQHLRGNREYEAAQRRWFATKPRALGAPGEPLPHRDELHDRGRIR